MNDAIKLGYDDESLLPKAQVLANALQLDIDNQYFPRLHLTETRLELHVAHFKPLFVDFNASTIQRRKQAGKSLELIRACSPLQNKRIIDATAGWGRDAALLAFQGARVVMIERHPIMYALLQDALSNLPDESILQKNLSLMYANSIDLIGNLSEEQKPDMIYLDPMHPTRTKSSLVKKEMQVLQNMIGEDIDFKCLLDSSLQIAKEKVIVKWPQNVSPIVKPHHSISGKTVRFDVYKTFD